ncbi:centrosome and spindle pole-associated protein 1-like [Elysia marginata]|uniref:Centrosome and spindle pole-associated protein 1-like n=1 Tax=Elysia marginata TaxID=1093978 RepID=A0AAV4JM44_9GAST|nr:centrosome and spindle pole-associated protein 1-like [Elysia marginata]
MKERKKTITKPIIGTSSGEPQSGSATQRRKNAYRQDLELQMKEKEAARIRERYQDMSVNASGWLDPEKRPDRLKPLGGAGILTDRSERDSKVRPYHTLFLYDRIDKAGQPLPVLETRRRMPYYVDSGDPHTLLVRPWQLNLDPVAPLVHQPATEATTVRPINDSINQAYNFYATRDLDRPGAYGSIIQPLVVPYVDNRPIIMPDRYSNRPQSHPHPRYNPFDNKNNTASEMRSLIAMLERERNKNSLAKNQDDLARRLRKEMEDERKRLGDRDADVGVSRWTLATSGFF